MSGKELLRTESLSVGYNKTSPPLHSNIDLLINEGEFVCLLGPNGAGKSTLIKTLCGFQKPLHGEIFYGTKPLQEIKDSARAKFVSVVLTDKLLLQNLTVFELVSLGRTPYTGFFGKLSEYDVNIVKNAIKEVGLGKFAHKAIDKISDGERQKAMIAKAIVQETPFIILDEPTAFLDLPAKLEIMQLLRRLSKKTNKGVLLSTHDLELAMQIADKIWLLAQGKEIVAGIPEDLIITKMFKEFFEKEGIFFDDSTGTFKYKIKNTKSVHLHVNSNLSKWVGRALVRNGYDTTEKETTYSISVTENGSNQFLFYKYDKLLAKCDSIQQLINVVKNNYA